MMKKKTNQESAILNRSVIAYIIAASIFLVAINFRLLGEQYSSFMGWKYICGDLKNAKDGVLYYDSVVHLHPDNIVAYSELADCYYRLQKYQNAMTTCQKAIALRPDSQILRQKLAHIYAKLKSAK